MLLLVWLFGDVTNVQGEMEVKLGVGRKEVNSKVEDKLKDE